MYSSVETIYFDRPGPANTDLTIRFGVKRAVELGIRYLVVASLTGSSALKLAKYVRDGGLDLRIVCVTFRSGWGVDVEGLLKTSREETWDLIPELKRFLEEQYNKGVKFIPYLSDNKDLIRRLEDLGVEVVVTTDLGMDIDSSLEEDLGMVTPRAIINATLLLFSSGVKVAFYAVLAAADAGKIPVDEEVVAFGGTELGLDTAVVIKPSYTDYVFNYRRGVEIREIICKPRSMMVGGIYLERRKPA